MGSHKLSPDLSARLAEAAAGEPVDVLLELHSQRVGAGSRRAMIEEAKADFGENARPVEAAITELGGQVTGMAWMNQTVRASVPASGVYLLAQMREVASVDTPYPLRRATAHQRAG